ncbi:RsmB/NOP family class I SAM-dependent RNA methyltransferase [Yoonia sp.]|uniref:RsmB/NOP family class I SAM-dependent RNA methyltransferase n=1 Tax=Yoonia sp. TaxID=2212373 RepID=UPI0019E2823D|nr:RsmB/NOP family class I SAM-dependent RNA methyltransferase [Yoonia sp.]MBE0414774.1 RsmB/NOP family class I SAM-dependent RNA methyltransferase [Yoonia sp.]
MTPGARVAAAIFILDGILAGQPAEQALTAWARASRFAGSKDRAAVRDHVFDALRAKRSLAARGGALTGRGVMIGLALRDDLGLDALFDGAGHAPMPLTDTERAQIAAPSTMSEPQMHDLPDWLWPAWCDSLGDQARAAALAQQKRADVFLRVNVMRGSVGGAISALATDNIDTVRHPTVTGCLRVTGNARRIKQARAYLDGLVELQDAASQFAVSVVPVPAQGRVLDYCAGGGGKALGFADQHDAAVFAHDISPARMADLPARAARAGVAVTIVKPDACAGAGPFDVVFCDAPCSGSGTWRRAPDAKWRLRPTDLAQLNQTQEQVINAAARLTGKDGMLVYATCSVLRAENKDIITRFVSGNPEWQVVFFHQLIPNSDCDGFYLCGLRRQADNL